MWHCTWCFPTTHMYYRKAHAYTHHDRFSADQDDRYFCDKVNRGVMAPGVANMTDIRQIGTDVTALSCLAHEARACGKDARLPGCSEGTGPLYASALALSAKAQATTAAGVPLAELDVPVSLLGALYGEEGGERERFRYLFNPGQRVPCDNKVVVGGAVVG